MQNDKNNKTLAALVVGVVLLGAGCAQTLPSSDGTVNGTRDREQSRDVSVAYQHGIDAVSWGMKDKATRVINETQGRTIDVEQIGGYIVEDPNAPGVFYFSTAASDKAQTEVFNGIYKFDSATLNWERLFKHTSAYDDPESVYVVVGMERDTLILKKLPYENVGLLYPSILDESIGEPNSLVRMPLDAPYSKLAPVDLTAEMREAIERDTNLWRPTL